MPNYEGPLSITEQDFQDVVDLINRVFRPNGGDMSRDYSRHVSLSNADNVRVIKQHGRVVSHVATSIRPVCLNGIVTKVAGIGAVATHPDARGQGFASLLMRDAVERSVAQGADIMLISGDEGIYKRMHAVECGRFPELRLSKNHCQLLDQVEIALAGDDIDAIIRLWDTMPTRYILPREDWEALAQCKHVMDKPSDWWLARFHNRPVGAGMVHRAGTELSILDWAGHPSALEGAAAFWFDHYRVETIRYTAAMESILPLSWRAAVERIRCFEGTVLVIEAQRFMERAKEFCVQRIGEQNFRKLNISGSEQELVFRLDDEELRFINGGAIAQLFFGHRELNILDRNPAADTELMRLLRAIFPIPLVWYGVGYV